MFDDGRKLGGHVSKAHNKLKSTKSFKKVKIAESAE